MQQELTTTNILSLLDTTKSERKSFALDVIEKIKDGEADALKIHCQVKSLESLVKMFTDKKDCPETAIDYANLVLSAAEKHGKKFGLFNGEFQIKEAGVVYAYDKCNDSVIDSLLNELDFLKEAIKARMDFLKTVPVSGLDIFNKETGEVETVYPPARSSTTVVAVQIK